MAYSRYSRAVRVLKIALPLVALGLLSLVFLISRDDFKGLERIIRYSDADLVRLSQGLRLSNPRFTGTTENGEPFVIKAEWAKPDKPTPERIELFRIDAKLEMRDGRAVQIEALNGEFLTGGQVVNLQGGVKVKTSDGYEAQTEQAEADMRIRMLTTPGPIVANGPLGQLKAGRMRAEQGDPKAAEKADDIIWFENGVELTYIPRKTP